MGLLALSSNGRMRPITSSTCPLVRHGLLALLDRRLQLLLILRRDLLLLVDILENVWVVALHEAVERLFKGAHLGQLHIIQEAADSRVDDAHLLSKRQRPELELLQHPVRRWPRSSWCRVAASSSDVPNWAKAASSRYWARSKRMPPAILRIARAWAAPPTRDTDKPTLIAGRIPALNRSASR